MAVLDVPELMNMFRQDELQKQAVAEAQRKQALEERAMALKEQPDVDFSFEKGGLKVKGKLKDLPALSQDPAFAPYLAGIGSTISNEQSLQNEDIETQRAELSDRLKDLQKKRVKQEIEIAKGDRRTFAMEAGLGLIGAKPRADVLKDIEAEAGVYKNKLAELGFNRQAGQMETNVPDYQSEAMPLQTTPQAAPETPAQAPAQQEAPRNFKSLQEARAAGVKLGQLIYINGKPGRLQARQ
ncbi:MAG: hypothetical protein EBZ05_09450 [Verrucomicrobia bacterium]|nr:hypothetical protein [Verrucomicrobiota bacterium]